MVHPRLRTVTQSAITGHLHRIASPRYRSDAFESGLVQVARATRCLESTALKLSSFTLWSILRDHCSNLLVPSRPALGEDRLKIVKRLIVRMTFSHNAALISLHPSHSWQSDQRYRSWPMRPCCASLDATMRFGWPAAEHRRLLCIQSVASRSCCACCAALSLFFLLNMHAK